MGNNHIHRPVRRGDFILLGVELVHNMMMAVENFTGSLLELAIYNAERETQIANAQDAFSQELEKLQEE